MHVPGHTGRGQRTTLWSQFSPSTFTWVPGTKLVSSLAWQTALPAEPLLGLAMLFCCGHTEVQVLMVMVTVMVRTEVKMVE